ncbi:MAG: CDP-alcohol phosphatidyltransferase family protein [Actinobacteria bacterium]|nr:CDP-alcohol phosphatidyltransferase family protein [Actinomycetota bacterium]
MTDASLYGPSAIATPANFVTVLRLLISPLLFSLVVQDQPSWMVFVLWVALATTDGIDGYIARRQGTTRSGAFLDPLADKVLVLGAMSSLAVIGRFAWVPVLIIAAREIAISLYRVYWGRRGLAIPARRSAKAKTLVQSIAVGAALFPALPDTSLWVANVLLWASVALAVVSAAQYFLDGSRAATSMQADA